ncbi:MAG: hypothetical protein KDA79_05085 [Planctomycetaceae bacterium]|nr:hypothetical protein [Planctomycetaceae bacterium]
MLMTSWIHAFRQTRWAQRMASAARSRTAEAGSPWSRRHWPGMIPVTLRAEQQYPLSATVRRRRTTRRRKLC